MRIASRVPLLSVLAMASFAPAGADSRETNEYGISLALRGSVARAESIFTGLLSTSPRDPRALNNLGNTYFLRGELDLALAFYNRAFRSDTGDAGIRLNRASTWLMMGDPDRASVEAAEGVARAGGEREAASLLGLRSEGGSAAPGKAAEAAWVNKGEIRALLAGAARKVPVVDTANARRSQTAQDAARKRNWRSAGPRGSEGTDAAGVLYWKR